MDKLSQLLLDWYDRNARKLPFRGIADPYAVWVSEIMLQQTRVETVIPYFQRWMEQFPTILGLASSAEQDVLKAWEGLGYYSRARNLWKAAQQVVERYGGKLPSDIKELESLPGIGRYTAGAIASIAFGQDQPALDGNIRRVLARVFNMDLPARSPQGEARLWELAREHLPPGRAGDFNQAVMDLGTAICTPRAPNCPVCPLNSVCMANILGIQEQLPVIEKKQPVPHYTVTAAILQKNGVGPNCSPASVLIARRPEDGLLGGLWDFPGGKQLPDESLPECLRREIREELGAEIAVGEPFGIYRHAYTHFKVTLHAFCCQLISGEPRPLQASELAWVTIPELKQYPMGKIDRAIALRITDTFYSPG